MNSTEINIAICRYARQHKFSTYTVRRVEILRFAAIRAYKQELAFRARQQVAA